ncbi:DUF4340 domain-containing protein [Luteolibacter flavescens]|uniref:DUF4340 domain-containing protein n=1 Tax=Luteolibacter flavescens TaxID=1859460 RepID=A0ABT3FMD0_9BACT|nr:DUF4340 domain-containing protein [Luteolibacter flavescens]MCW1884730.1 DUF4340 domain-containing protein [Luteolibacter flavescens]
MRSISFTLLLLVVTTGVTMTAAMRFSEGSLDRLLGPKSAVQGDRLYDFDPQKIHRILLSGNGVKAECVFEKGIWRVAKPWDDRMDPSAADGILNFTLGTRVEEIIPEGKIDSSKAGLVEGTIGVRIEDKDGNSLATYLLGRKTEWLHRDPKTKEEIPTVFLQPQDDAHGGDIYATTGDIHFLFRDGLRHLRDHHPLFFNPAALQSVRIQSSESEVLLSRTGGNAPWLITKPLELRTDTAAVTKLLTDLYLLRAVKIADRSEVTLPADDVNGRQKIAIKHFGQNDETVMEILPPATPEADTVFATVSDRPGSVFELRLKPLAPTLTSSGTPATNIPAEDLVSIAGLPDTVNELRDPRLTDLKVEDLEGILISPANSDEIVLARPKGGRWQVQNPAGRMEPLNEMSLYRLLKALTETKVIGFPSDAAVDLAPYGLDRPALKLRIVTTTDATVDLHFGQSRDGTWHAMHNGVPRVMKLDDAFIHDIATRVWQWRLTDVWNVASIDLAFIEREVEGYPKLMLEYNWGDESWKAQENGTDRSAELITERANRLLDPLLKLRCDTWLSPDDANARNALAKPAIRFTLGVHQRDALGEKIGIQRRELLLAPASDSPTNRLFYGRVGNEALPFMMSADSVSRLVVDLFGDD